MILIIIKFCERMLGISLKIIHVFDKLYPWGGLLYGTDGDAHQKF